MKEKLRFLGLDVETTGSSFANFNMYSQAK